MSWIEIHTGDRFYVSAPQMHMYDVEVAIHALPHLCRFVGQCRDFYSVAEHSVLVARMLPDELKPFGLLHDMCEAYYGDVASPTKELCHEYKAVEHQAQDAIYDQVLGRVPSRQEKAEVKQADLQALKVEAQSLLPNRGRDWPCLQGVVVCPSMAQHIHCLYPREARKLLRDAVETIIGGVI